MENKHFNAIGVVEITFFTNALIVLDEMLKSADVHLVACEKKLGGRMVSIIVGGDTSSVNASVEAALQAGSMVGPQNIKVAVTISNPHPQIRKLLNYISSPNQNPPEEPQKKVSQTQDEDTELQEKKLQNEPETENEKLETDKNINQTQKPKIRRTKS